MLRPLATSATPDLRLEPPCTGVPRPSGPEIPRKSQKGCCGSSVPECQKISTKSPRTRRRVKNRGPKLSAAGISRQMSRDIPPKCLFFLGFEGCAKLFGPHRFTWKIPTRLVDIRTLSSTPVVQSYLAWKKVCDPDCLVQPPNSWIRPKSIGEGARSLFGGWPGSPENVSCSRATPCKSGVALEQETFSGLPGHPPKRLLAPSPIDLGRIQEFGGCIRQSVFGEFFDTFLRLRAGRPEKTSLELFGGFRGLCKTCMCREMLQILAFQALAKANLPRTLSRHCPEPRPNLPCGMFFEINSY